MDWRPYLTWTYHPFWNWRPIRVLTSGWVRIPLLVLTPPYFIVMDVWGDRWQILKDSSDFHWIVFWLLLGAYTTCEALNTIRRRCVAHPHAILNQVLESFIAFTGRVVNAKTQRFREYSKKVQKNSNVFKQITKPELQIQLMIQELEELIRKNFSIEYEELDINIIGKSHFNDEWTYMFKGSSPKKHRTKASTIMTAESAARRALEQGIAVFCPEKDALEPGECYYRSERDQKNPKGSIFCIPIIVDLPNGAEDQYVVNINTYGIHLCGKADEGAKKFIKFLFHELCKRLELELILLSTKSWLKNASKATEEEVET